MSIEQMKQALLKAYPHSSSWAAKVEKMRDPQVIATYHRLLNTKGL